MARLTSSGHVVYCTKLRKKCSDSCMEGKFSALLGNYDRPTDRPISQATDRPTNRQTGSDREASLLERLTIIIRGRLLHEERKVSLGKVRLFNIPVKCIVHIILDACGKHKQILMIQGWYYYDLELSRILRNPYSQNSWMEYFFTKQKKIKLLDTYCLFIHIS